MNFEIDPTPAKRPERIRLEGRYVTLVPMDAAAHGDALWEKTGGPANERLWQYMFDGPFPDRHSFDAYMKRRAAAEDPLTYAILDKKSGDPVGHLALMRIEPNHRCIEIGGIMFSPALQRTRGATEAIYLLARYIFDDLGYRRCEWKCHFLNEPSRRAALRLGFTFEGIFRQHMIMKGSNRDTAWFSMLDREWPARKLAFERWLDPSNFDAEGRQKSSLSACAREACA
jgi:RimJ/RimL family protein N-acetyltransferase